MLRLERREVEDVDFAQLAEDGMFLGCGDEERELALWFFLEFFEHFFCALDGFIGQAGEFCDVDAVALVGAAFDDFSKEDDARGDFLYGGLEVDRVGEFIFEFCEFPIVGREESFGLLFVGCEEVFGNCPGDGNSIVGTSATANLIQENE